MAPNLVKVSSLGYIEGRASRKWHRRATIDGKDIYGPDRTAKKRAIDDRTKARRGATRAEFVKFVRSLHTSSIGKACLDRGKLARFTQVRKRLRTKCNAAALLQGSSKLAHTQEAEKAAASGGCAHSAQTRKRALEIMTADLLHAATEPPNSCISSRAVAVSECKEMVAESGNALLPTEPPNSCISSQSVAASECKETAAESANALLPTEPTNSCSSSQSVAASECKEIVAESNNVLLLSVCAKNNNVKTNEKSLWGRSCADQKGCGMVFCETCYW